MRFANNILSFANNYFSAQAAFFTDDTMLGAYDYNLLADSFTGSVPDWFGANNITNVAAEWSAGDTALALSAGSSAINAGIDLTQAFTLKGTNYSALPSTSITKAGAQWDIGAFEFQSSSGIGRSRRHGGFGFGFGN